MNIAMILAGGRGVRLGRQIPKQFVRVLGKPILIHTLEVFQNHPRIDAIQVVCLAGYEGAVRMQAEAYGITKLRWVVAGGESSQESSMNGIFALEGQCAADDIVLQAMGVNPLIGDDIIDDALDVCLRCGNAATAECPPYLFPVRVTGEGQSSEAFARKDVALLSMPMATSFGKAQYLYRRGKAENVGMGEQCHITTLLMAFGEPVYFSKSSRRNIKITTEDDIAMFRALLLAKDSGETDGEG